MSRSFAVGVRPLTEFPEFFEKWHSEFRKHATDSSQRDFWEGHAAYRELSRAGLFGTMMQEGTRRGWQFDSVMSKILREVQLYKKYKGIIGAFNREQPEASRLLLKTEKELAKLVATSKVPEIQKLLTGLATEVSSCRAQIDQAPETLWETPRGGYVECLAQPERVKRPYREIDLDTELQIKVAKLLRFGLCPRGRVSLTTVGRLVLLVYLAAGLVEDSEGCAFLPHSNRELKVPEIVQRLRRTGKLK